MGDVSFLSNRTEDDILRDVGTALLHVKTDRRLNLTQMGAMIGVSRTMMSQYIAGEAEMGWLSWQKVNEVFPEIAGLIEETAYDRAMRARQRALDLDLPRQRKAKAA